MITVSRFSEFSIAQLQIIATALEQAHPNLTGLGEGRDRGRATRDRNRRFAAEMRRTLVAEIRAEIESRRAS